jgi:hypothetical protein
MANEECTDIQEPWQFKVTGGSAIFCTFFFGAMLVFVWIAGYKFLIG